MRQQVHLSCWNFNFKKWFKNSWNIVFCFLFSVFCFLFSVFCFLFFVFCFLFFVFSSISFFFFLNTPLPLPLGPRGYCRGLDLTPNNFFSRKRFFLGRETVILCGVVCFSLFWFLVFGFWFLVFSRKRTVF